MSNKKPNIIIICDSRGRGLQNFVDSHPESSNYYNTIEILPGRDINQIAINAIQTISNLSTQNFYCVIFAGICSLTERTTIAGTQRIHYPLNNRTNKVREVINTIRDLKQRYSNSINICTIVPASLNKYFQHHNPQVPAPEGLDAEQNALLEDIEEINQEIVNINAGAITNINLSKRFFKQAKRKRQKIASTIYRRRVLRFTDCDLPDGVHLSEDSKLTCFSLIYESAIRDLSHRPLPSPEEEIILDLNSSQDSSDSEQKEWDFKRKSRAGTSRRVLCAP